VIRERQGIRITEGAASVAVVITQGTDTIEETAYLLSRSPSRMTAVRLHHTCCDD
jgi:hypothetical protein